MLKFQTLTKPSDQKSFNSSIIKYKLLVQTILPKIDEEGKIILDPEEITKIRTRQLRNRSILEYLIKWKNLPMEDSTWEYESFIQHHPELLQG